MVVELSERTGSIDGSARECRREKKIPVRVYAQGCLVGDLAAGGLAVAEVEFGLWDDGDEEVVLAQRLLVLVREERCV